MIDIAKTFEELRTGVKTDAADKPDDGVTLLIVLTSLKLLECALIDLRRIADAADGGKAAGHYRPLSGEPHS